MMLYLTGSEISLMDSQNAPQNDPFNSIGGNISSTPVPNGEVNALFDLVSSYSLEKKNSETVAIALVNRFDFPVTNVKIKTLVKKDRLCRFKIGAVAISEEMCMEQLPNRYAEPMGCEFFDSDFESPSVDVTMLSPAVPGEEIAVIPLDVVFTVEEGGYDGTWDSFEQAFSNNEDYYVERVSEKIFRIYSKRETALEEPISISIISTNNFRCEVSGKMENRQPMNELTLVEDGNELAQGSAIGLWIKREFLKNKKKSNEELVRRYLERYIEPQQEYVELIITYDKKDK